LPSAYVIYRNTCTTGKLKNTNKQHCLTPLFKR
jgi:hypothetical protein